jgi:hypothetical protein
VADRHTGTPTRPCQLVEPDIYVDNQRLPPSGFHVKPFIWTTDAISALFLPLPVVHITGWLVFSIIQRKVIKPADFADLAALGDRLERFEGRYNATAVAFDWRFTRADLAEMLARIETHAPAASEVPVAA